MAHLDFLGSVFNVSGKDVADIGAGDGTFSRQLGERGAVVTGIEIDPAKVEAASRNLSGNVSMPLGRAEVLPLDDGSTDLACFFFSFHHVPTDIQPQALAEVRRILRPGGRLHVVEPFPYGSMFDVVRMVEDETEVRTHSHRLMNALGDGDEFDRLARHEYKLTREFPDFDDFVTRIVRPDPERSALFPSVRNAMENTYNSVVSEQNGKRVLHQPCAAYHFEIRS